MSNQGLMIKKAEAVEALQVLCGQNGGLLKPEAVVEAAADEHSPLHHYFEWDDTVAAKTFRLVQARLLVNAVHVKIIGSDDKPRLSKVFVSLSSDRYNGEGGYRRVIEVMSDRDMRRTLIDDAVKDMESFSLRYKKVRELGDVFTAMEKAKKKINKNENVKVT